MKKFAITGIAAGDIANLRSVYVKSDGANIIVTGQNGAGKSTLAKTILWTLMGSTADGEKLIPIDGDGLPYAEVELTDGVTITRFRKEIIQRVSKGVMSRSTDCFLNGFPVTLKDFQEFFNQYISAEGFQILIGLGNFFKLKPADQRRILTENFSQISDDELAAEIGLDTQGRSIEKYVDWLKSKIRQTKKALTEIPIFIKSLEMQTVEVVDDRKTLEFEKHALEMELQEMIHKMALSDEIRAGLNELKGKAGLATQDYWQRRKEYDALKDEIAGAERGLEKMREQYEMPLDNCPMCGQAIQGERADRIRDKIALEGQKLSAKIESYKVKLAKIAECGKIARQDMDALNKKLEVQDFDSAEYNAASKRRDVLQREIAERNKRIAKIEMQIELNERNEDEVAELKAREKKFGANLSEYEGQLALCEEFTRRKMDLVTDAINSHFQFVKFQMFETLKNGEVKNTCTATLNGVAYENLSKGEKFKVALDVLNAFQNYYGVMLPLIIDDAESYTSNSLIEIANQQILLKAVEGRVDLQISSGTAEKRRIA